MHAVIAHNLSEKIRTKDVLLEENVNFASLLLPATILKGLSECGFRKPSPIQFKAIPLGRCGFDLIIKSKSGTGKTLVFSTIALEAVNTSKNHLQILILVPTREIAVQIQDVLKNIGRFIKGLNINCFIGGLPLEDDIKKAKQCHIAVGAPGRVKHLITKGALSTEFVRLFVLDEADKLMETSFQNDINEIYNTLPQRKQIIASSATYPQELDSFLSNYMLSPTHVSSENETPILLGLKQFVSVIKTSNPNVVQSMKLKNEKLLEIFSKISFTQCLVFSNYQTRAESISNYLNQKGWNSSFISAAQSQVKRLEAVNNLKEFKSRILLTTDLTSRGIDAPNVDFVINYDVPQDPVTYLHRMGRAGRYGSSGICLNLTLDGEELRHLQNILGTISGSNISISVLPSLSENKTYDLWHLDSGNFEQIQAVVSSDTLQKMNEDIKNEVLALKQTKQKNNAKKNDQSEKNYLNCVKDLLDNKKKETEEVCEKLSEIDTDTLLQSLISGDVPLEINNVDRSECEKENLLVLMNAVSEEDTKKRKRILINEELQQEKRTNNSIFCKNKALLCITKLILNPNLAIDEDLVMSVHEHLTVFKKEESEDFKGKSVEEILGRTKEVGTKTEVVVKTVEEDVVEDIFTIGYQCAVKKDKMNWEDYLSKDELQAFQEMLKQELVISSSDNEEEEEDFEDCEMPEEIEQVAENEDVALQWVPVVPTENSNQVRNEHYTKCYENCSNLLWQSGLTFETVEDFDNWYYHWQEQLQSVRRYVQENIYVEEMSKYQQSRFANT